MSTYEAFITRDWQKMGLAQVVVTRRRGASLDAAAFLVDAWCLGVKDATVLDDAFEDEAHAFADGMLPAGVREAIDPHCARKFIEGAVAYAERLGFAPHRDYRKARRLLSGLDAARCPTEFTYGRDGRPFYLQGAESTEAADRVVARLEALLGEDGFDFQLNEEDDVLAVRDELMEFLEAQPDTVPHFYSFSGMITAALLTPQPMAPAEVVAFLWNPEEPNLPSSDEMQEFLRSVMVYWNSLADVVSEACADNATPGARIVDLWVEDCPEGTDSVDFVGGALIEWAEGFVYALESWPEKWGDVLTRPELAEPLALVRAYAALAAPGSKERIEASANAGVTLDQAIVAIGRVARPELR